MHETLVTNKERKLFCTDDLNKILYSAGIKCVVMYKTTSNMEICVVALNNKMIEIEITKMSLFHILITVVNTIKEKI